MVRMVFCKKLGTETMGLEHPPYPGELGQRIYENISQQAWASWLEHQTMLINEYRLNLMDKKAREFLQTEMKRFLFSDDAEKPPGFKPKND